jgi:hypothetical protein
MLPDMHPSRMLLSGLVLFAACGGGGSDADAPPSGPDAPRTPDGPTTDAPPVVPDSDPNCGAGELCLRIAPVDGVDVLPQGRIAIAWVPPDGGGGPTTYEVAYDQVWFGDPEMSITLVDINLPSAPYLQADPPFCPGSSLAGATVVVSTDPDGDGAITSAEIEAGLTDGTVYGIGQAIIAYFTIACPPSPPEFPDGFLAGSHVYTKDIPVMVLDAMFTDLQTCAPQSPECANLNNPF